MFIGDIGNKGVNKVDRDRNSNSNKKGYNYEVRI